MWEAFTEALRAQLANQVVAGAIALGLLGVLVAALRKVPGALWSQAKRALVVTATLDSRNDLFPAFVAWMDVRQPAADGGADGGRCAPRRRAPRHRERLDPALIRPGRIDVEVELGNASAAQLQGLLLRFHPDAGERAARLASDYPPGALSPAQIQQILIEADSLDEAEAGLRGAWQSQ